MSWHLQNQVDKNAEARLYKSIYETAVMRALAAFANDDGGSCFPALNTLAQRSQCSERTVGRVIKEFKKRKWVRIKHTGRSNQYQIMAHGHVAPQEEISTQNVDKPRISRERVALQSDQSGLTIRSDRSECPTSMDVESNDSYQIKSSSTPHQISLSRTNSADALKERNNVRHGVGREEGNQEEDSLVTELNETAGARTPLDNEGDCGGYPPAARPAGGAEEEDMSAEGDVQHMLAAAYMEAEKNRPPGMPSLEEFFAETNKIKLSDQGALQLYDTWLANGFTIKNAPIKDWRAAMRNWKRWLDNGGYGVFS